MIKTNHWVNVLWSLIFIVAPAFVGYFFLLPDWNKKISINYGFYWLMSFGYLLYVSFVLFLTIKLEILGIDAIRFNAPIALVFVSIFVSYNWHIAIRAIFAIAMIFTAWPFNIFADYLIDDFRKNNKKFQ